jgi:hypothetical protein
MFHFLFAADPLDPRLIDSHFDEQRKQILRAGFSASLVPDATFQAPSVLRGIHAGALVIYRGWMIDERQYANLVTAIELSGAVPYTSLDRYLLTHHLPNWYPLLSDLTAETVVLPEHADVSAELRKLAWPGYFLKDYVKSLKTSTGSLISTPEEAPQVLEEMRLFRGVIEGGICVRRKESFVPNTELRYFVIARHAYAPGEMSVPQIAQDVAARVDSPFFSIDIALSEAGVSRVVEVGDGQVSDLVGWSAESFAKIWQTLASTEPGEDTERPEAMHGR